MRVLALTGSVAAGKSSVGALFEEWGTPVLSADAVVRDLQRSGEPVYDAIVSAFGTAIVAANGELDRAALRRRILEDPAARHALEAIVHPAIEPRRRTWLDAARARGEPLVVADIPLLFEVADPAAYDGVIVVDAPVAERRRRLIDDRGLSPREADQLLDAQLPAAAKRARATWVIDNDSSRDVLRARARHVWDQLPR
ncbi:MAG TPA: dephospho-CoA kinase [Gemmatimonadales bacterium]|jgi:dephospho-CoA kinase